MQIARLLEAVHDENELDSLGIAPSQSFKGLEMLKDPPKLTEEEEVRLLMEASARENAEPPVSPSSSFSLRVSHTQNTNFCLAEANSRRSTERASEEIGGRAGSCGF